MPAKRETTPPPERPSRNYSTIVPSKPPRQKSLTSLNGDQRKRQTSRSSPDITQYEEVDDVDPDSHRDLHSGEVIEKMKFRPLPPPPRPPRDKKSKKSETKHDDDDDHMDNDGGGETILGAEARTTDTETMESGEPAAVHHEEDEKISEPKTLQEILKKEQEAELERARQLADAKNLERGITRFRESSQRNFSEKSRTSTADRPKTPGSRPPSRPMTPAALVIEKRTSTPTIQDNANQTITEVRLMMQPIDMDDDIEDNEIVQEIEQQIIREEKDEAAKLDDEEKEINVEAPTAPPRRKSSALDTVESSI